mmetsp:Transcript_28055/g.61252  ORF Transcript_28055/g.61252 Transcript_28055/m.61252 type:complete len:230 (-) Transcript_28055:1342-2031(-)
MAHHLLNEEMLLASLQSHKFPLALLADLEECVHRHFLDTWETLVHELEKLEDDCLQKSPMGSEEPRVLAHDIHDVARDHGLVLLAPLHLAQTQQILDHRQQEALLVALVHGTANGADRPAEAVEERRRPALSRTLGEALLCEALKHDGLHALGVQMREVDQCLPHHLVQSYLVCVLLLRTDNVTLLVLFNCYFWRLGHLRDKHVANLRYDRLVPLPLRTALLNIRRAAA